jgi:hypothetical protein
MIEAQAINRISLTFAPSVTIVFLFGLLWKCGDLRAALAILGIGYKDRPKNNLAKTRRTDC